MGEKGFHIVIIGAGGLGVAAAWGLAEYWKDDTLVGFANDDTRDHPRNDDTRLRVRIFDPDTVELSNLARQPLYTERDLNSPKATTLASTLNNRLENKNISFFGVQRSIHRGNIHSSLNGAHLVLDACDSVSTKFLINEYCMSQKLPFIYGGAVGYSGQLLLVNPSNPSSACLRCLFEDLSEKDESCLGPSCREAGILGPIVAEIGFLQAEIAVDYLKGKIISDEGSLYYHSQPRRTLLIRRNNECQLHHMKATASLDLRDKKCPSTFLFTKLALEKLQPGETLQVHFSQAESAQNVRASIAEEGHIVMSGPTKLTDAWELVLSKGMR